MHDILTFTLAAPLGSMGSLAVGEQRGTWDRPARSAVLGLIAGCLGLLRTEEDEHAALSAGLGVAIRRLGGASALLTDYHTVQSSATRRGRAPATRREELAGERETILTRRDYRTDLCFTLAVWRRTDLRWSLAELAEALNRPIFIPNFGRKSCPLALPMAPRIIAAETIEAALRQRDAQSKPPEQAALFPGTGTLWADVPGPDCPPLGVPEAAAMTDQRRDAPGSRVRRQFYLRTECVAVWAAP